MTLTFQPVTLDTTVDQDAQLVFRAGRLLAVVTHLSDIHGERSGHWFVEALFAPITQEQTISFESLEHIVEWLGKKA